MDPKSEFNGALTRVGIASSPELPYFAPDVTRHFDPISVAVGVGGALLLAYLKGIQAEGEGEAEAAGKATVKWLRRRLSEAFSRRRGVDISEVRSAAASASDSLVAADVDTRAELLSSARTQFAGMLKAEFRLPSSNASRLSIAIEAEANRLMLSIGD